MRSALKIRDAAGWTMFVFGLLALVLGVVGVVRPELLLTLLGFSVLERASRASGDYTLVLIMASSIASLIWGAYYILAAFNNLRAYYKWTVPYRCVTFIAFTSATLAELAPARFAFGGLWELLGASATGLALRFDNQ